MGHLFKVRITKKKSRKEKERKMSEEHCEIKLNEMIFKSQSFQFSSSRSAAKSPFSHDIHFNVRFKI